MQQSDLYMRWKLDRTLTSKPPLRWISAYRWRVGIRPRTSALAVTGHLDDFKFLEAPFGHFHADPFVVEHEGQVFLFFEDYNYLTRSASLACAELDSSCNVLQVRTIVQKPYHMSYPHVFVFDGCYYMIPETAAVNRVELYRAVKFPWEWTFEKVLLHEAKLHDATCVASDDKYWILAGGSSTGLPGHHDQLHVFFAPTIFDSFTPHARNPVKTDLGSARPAGAIVKSGERLIRPAQDCSRYYGCGLTFMEIEVISESAYSERALASLPDSWLGHGDLGTHTYNASEHFEVIDVCSYGVELAAIIGRARSLARKAARVGAQIPAGCRERPLA